jgi:hypothetical protein
MPYAVVSDADARRQRSGSSGAAAAGRRQGMTEHDAAPALALIRDITEVLERATEQDHGPLVRQAAAARGWSVREGGGGWALEDGDGRTVAVRFDAQVRVEEMTAEVSG